MANVFDKVDFQKLNCFEATDELKNIRKIGHTRHRSVKGFLVNLVAALTAYGFFPKKPSLNITPIQEPIIAIGCLNSIHVSLERFFFN